MLQEELKVLRVSFYSFVCNMAAPPPTLGHCREDGLTQIHIAATGVRKKNEKPPRIESLYLKLAT